MHSVEEGIPESFWLGRASQDIVKPQTKMFEVNWLSTNEPGHPGFQKVMFSLVVSLLNAFLDICRSWN